MVKPKLIVFDFGGTLFDDGEFQLYEGMEALRLAADNAEAVTTEYMCNLFRGIMNIAYEQYGGDDKAALEVPLAAVFRNIFARSGLKYSIDLTECEVVFDRNDSSRTPTPYITELIDFLNKSEIHTAIISNTAMSGEAMAKAIQELIPQNRMQFVLTSADYMLRKPAPDMFKAAVQLAGVRPDECWYCGDGVIPDVGGAHNSGMLPVLYDRRSEVPFAVKEKNGKEYFIINSWLELIKKLEI